MVKKPYMHSIYFWYKVNRVAELRQQLEYKEMTLQGTYCTCMIFLETLMPNVQYTMYTIESDPITFIYMFAANIMCGVI